MFAATPQCTANEYDLVCHSRMWQSRQNNELWIGSTAFLGCFCHSVSVRHWAIYSPVCFFSYALEVTHNIFCRFTLRIKSYKTIVYKCFLKYSFCVNEKYCNKRHGKSLIWTPVLWTSGHLPESVFSQCPEPLLEMVTGDRNLPINNIQPVLLNGKLSHWSMRLGG